jgi:hypothetical protein
MQAEMATDDPDRSQDITDNRGGVNNLLDDISAAQFNEWYQNRKFRQNIRDGKQYFNGPSAIPSPERLSPSTLLHCHRKIYYRQVLC